MPPMVETAQRSARRHIVAGAGALLALGVAAFGASAARSEALAVARPQPAQCIDTAAGFKQAFESCAPIPCVGTDLYGVIGQGTPAEQTSIYPPSFRWAWVSGTDNLQQYADWQAQACAGELPKSEVTHRILLYVGFGEQDIVKGSPYTLSVLDLGNEDSLFVPTPAAWFQAFQQTFGLQFPLATQKAMTLGLGDQSNRANVALDPTRNFAAVTGCSPEAAARCSDQPLSACSADYAAAASILQDHSPVTGTGSTAACVTAFKRYLLDLGRAGNAAEARAMLRYCEDVNPCNSGLGFGFNPAYPGPGGKTLEHFTGPEYVLRNQPLNSVGAARIRLTAPR